MKSILILLSFLLPVLSQKNCNSSSSSSASVSHIGKWQCDHTGTIKAKNQAGEWEIKPVTEFYDALNIKNIIYEFKADGTVQTTSEKLDGTKHIMDMILTMPYQGVENKFLLQSQQGTQLNDESLGEILSVSANKLNLLADLEADGDAIFNLNMIRIN